MLNSELAKVSIIRDFVPAYRKIPSLVLLFVTCYFEVVSIPQGSKVYTMGDLKTKLGIVIEGKLMAKFQENSKGFSILQVSSFLTQVSRNPSFNFTRRVLRCPLDQKLPSEASQITIDLRRPQDGID